MKKMHKLLIIFLVVIFSFPEESHAQMYNYPSISFRDAFQWPFSQNSIWNTPIGDGAVFVDAHLMPALKKSCSIDEDIIVLTPDAPKVDIYYSDAKWNKNKSRCIPTGSKLMTVPIPNDFVVNPSTWEGTTPNAGLAVLMTDNFTIKQTQPFARCEKGGNATSAFSKVPDQNLYGDGIYGVHGGSGLSAIGGTLRVGELTRKSAPIRHVLKVNLYAAKNLYYDSINRGCCWPALRADNYAAKVYSSKRTSDIVKECRMGALLAIPPTITISSLNIETEPGLILAQAMQDFGAYVVDDTAWDVNAFIVEWGPNGRFSDEFRKSWGYNFATEPSTPWGRDVAKIFANLHVVVNNSSSSVGGGGKRRAPLAPPFKNR